MSWPLSDIFSHTLEIQKPPLVSSRLVPTGKKINAAMGFKPIILAKMVNFTQSAVTKRELRVASENEAVMWFEKLKSWKKVEKKHRAKYEAYPSAILTICKSWLRLSRVLNLSLLCWFNNLQKFAKKPLSKTWCLLEINTLLWYNYWLTIWKTLQRKHRSKSEALKGIQTRLCFLTDNFLQKFVLTYNRSWKAVHLLVLKEILDVMAATVRQL